MDNTTREYEMISIEKIIINPENPRHNPIIGECGEVFIMKQLISNKREANAMHKLISDIFDNGWYAQSILTVTYDEKEDKYLAWDGNRRATALKLLKNPKILENFKTLFSYNAINSIYKMHNEINDESFFFAPCYIADSFKDCEGYIRNIHTNDTGALPWNQTAIKRFENRIGNKNIFIKLQEMCPDAFKDIKKDFKVRMFEKMVSSKIGKEYLDIKFDNGVIIPNEDINKLNEKVTKIVDDISKGKITSETVQNNVNIHKHFYDEGENGNKKEKTNKEDIKKDINQVTIDDFIVEEGYAKHDNEIIFSKIKVNKIDDTNLKAKTLRNICLEVKKMSKDNIYLDYPIAYSYLLNSLLEQASIYFLINKHRYETYRIQNNYSKLSLEQLIGNINREKDELITNEEIKKAWKECFNTEKGKDLINMVIYHSDKINQNNIKHIKEISNLGLFSIIQYFIDEKRN